jgi:hypothetical protein
LLESNRKHYIEDLPYNSQTKLTKFVHVYDKIRDLHENKLNADFQAGGHTIEQLCDLFTKYFEEKAFKVYYDYIKHFKQAAKILKNVMGNEKVRLKNDLK